MFLPSWPSKSKAINCSLSLAKSSMSIAQENTKNCQVIVCLTSWDRTHVCLWPLDTDWIHEGCVPLPRDPVDEAYDLLPRDPGLVSDDHRPMSQDFSTNYLHPVCPSSDLKRLVDEGIIWSSIFLICNEMSSLSSWIWTAIHYDRVKAISNTRPKCFWMCVLGTENKESQLGMQSQRR